MYGTTHLRCGGYRTELDAVYGREYLAVMKLTELILIVVGAAMLAAYFGARAHGDAARIAAIAAFESTLPQPAPAERPLPVVDRVPAAPAVPDQGDWSDTRRAKYAATEPRGAPLAVLRIESVALEVPVFAGTGERELNRGAGHIPGTAAPGAPGNAGIAAHRDGWFRSLEHVELGDVVELVTHSGRMTYRVNDLTVVEPSEVSVLDPTDEATLTLVTCYPFYFVGSAPQRYIVRAVAIN